MADATPDGVSPADRLRQHVVCVRLRVSPPQRLCQHQLHRAWETSVQRAVLRGVTLP